MTARHCGRGLVAPADSAPPAAHPPRPPLPTQPMPDAGQAVTSRRAPARPTPACAGRTRRARNGCAGQQRQHVDFEGIFGIQGARKAPEGAATPPSAQACPQAADKRLTRQALTRVLFAFPEFRRGLRPLARAAASTQKFAFPEFRRGLRLGLLAPNASTVRLPRIPKGIETPGGWGDSFGPFAFPEFRRGLRLTATRENPPSRFAFPEFRRGLRLFVAECRGLKRSPSPNSEGD